MFFGLDSKENEVIDSKHVQTIRVFESSHRIKTPYAKYRSLDREAKPSGFWIEFTGL